MNPNVPPQGYQPPPAQFYPQTNPVGPQSMMWFPGASQGTEWLMGILWFITWILIIAVLFALLRFLWKMAEDSRKK